MKIDQLIYFLETARFEHVGKAAKSLSISRSAISHSISQLEEEMGQSFFEKRGRNIVFNEAGRQLQARAQTWLDELDVIKREVSANSQELKGHFRLGASHLLCSRLLVPSWNSLAQNEEALSSEIYSLRSADVMEGVVSGELDFGICFSPQKRVELDMIPIYKGQLNLYVKKNHPVLKQKYPYRGLSQYHNVLPKAFKGIDVCETHPMIEKFDLHSKLRFAYDSYEVALEYLAKSNDWAILPDWVVSQSKAKLACVAPPKGWDAPFDISIIYRSNRVLAHALELLKETLTSQ